MGALENVKPVCVFRRGGSRAAQGASRSAPTARPQTPATGASLGKRIDMTASLETAATTTAAVVVHYRGYETTSRCLEALRRLRPGPGRVILVDNGSTDGTGPRLAKAFPEVEFLPLPRNRGYGAGCNAGAEPALAGGARFLWFLNSDVEPVPDCLGILLEAAAAFPKAGLFTPALRLADGRREGTGVRISELTGRVRAAGFGRKEGAGGEPVEVDAAYGTALLVRAEVFREAGGFDEDYFLYFEDLDLSLRARRAGWKALAVPRARAVHRGSASFGGRDSAERLYYAVRSHLRFSGSLPGGGSAALKTVRESCILLFNTLHVLRSGECRSLAGLAWAARGAVDFYRDRKGPVN